MGIFSFLFGKRDSKVKNYLSKGATILDVRTDREYQAGSIDGSMHIPLQELHNRFTELNSNQSYIVVCQSGVRSAKATKFLNLNDFDAINGGGWQRLRTLL